MIRFISSFNLVMKMIPLLFSFILIGISPGAEKDEDERPVIPERLTTLIAKADRVVVKDTRLEKEQLLFESAKRKDLDALAKALVVEKPEQEFHCMCAGTEALLILRNFVHS